MGECLCWCKYISWGGGGRIPSHHIAPDGRLGSIKNMPMVLACWVNSSAVMFSVHYMSLMPGPLSHNLVRQLLFPLSIFYNQIITKQLNLLHNHPTRSSGYHSGCLPPSFLFLSDFHPPAEKTGVIAPGKGDAARGKDRAGERQSAKRELFRWREKGFAVLKGSIVFCCHISTAPSLWFSRGSNQHIAVSL